MLEAILSVLDSHLVEPFLCTTWIESSTLPLTVSEDANPRFDLSATANDETLHAANLFVYAAYLDRLSHRYESAPQSFTFVWSVERGMDHATVDALYAYSYFQLHATPRLSSFVVSFHEQEEMGDMSGFSAMSHLYTYIDTEKRDAETAHLRQSLGIDTWGEISEQIDDGNLVLRSLYESRASLALPDTVRGEFFYADFASAFHMDGWFAGYGCEAIRLAYGQSGNRALQIEMTTDADIPSEAFWLYEYPENFVYTPYVALNLFLEANGTSSLYEVRVTVGEGKDRQVTSAVIHPNENSRLVMDLSPYSQAHMADYWKISVRSLDGDADSVSVWVYDIVGYSTDLDSDALREAILAERARIRNLSGDAAQTDSADDLWTVLAIVVLILVIGVGVFIGIRSQDNTEKERDSDERS